MFVLSPERALQSNKTNSSSSLDSSRESQSKICPFVMYTVPVLSTLHKGEVIPCGEKPVTVKISLMTIFLVTSFFSADGQLHYIENWLYLLLPPPPLLRIPVSVRSVVPPSDSAKSSFTSSSLICRRSDWRHAWVKRLRRGIEYLMTDNVTC